MLIKLQPAASAKYNHKHSLPSSGLIYTHATLAKTEFCGWEWDQKYAQYAWSIMLKNEWMKHNDKTNNNFRIKKKKKKKFWKQNAQESCHIQWQIFKKCTKYCWRHTTSSKYYFLPLEITLKTYNFYGMMILHHTLFRKEKYKIKYEHTSQAQIS